MTRAHAVGPGHTRLVFDPETFPEVVRWVALEARAAGAQAIAGSGHSGLIVAGAVSYLLRIPVIAVRKPDEKPKADGKALNLNVPLTATRYVIVDDMIGTGETVRRIVNTVYQVLPQLRPAAILLYYTAGWVLEWRDVPFDVPQPPLRVMGR